MGVEEIKKAFTPESCDLIGLNLLKRMRKYQLISSTRKFEDRVIAGISPCLNYRIIKYEKEDQ